MLMSDSVMAFMRESLSFRSFVFHGGGRRGRLGRGFRPGFPWLRGSGWRRRAHRRGRTSRSGGGAGVALELARARALDSGGGERDPARDEDLVVLAQDHDIELVEVVRLAPGGDVELRDRLPEL